MGLVVGFCLSVVLLDILQGLYMQDDGHEIESSHYSLLHSLLHLYPFLFSVRDKFKAMARTFTWKTPRHQKLNNALRDQISHDTPLACIWEDATIGSHADRSLKSISIGNGAIQAFTDCLTGDQRGHLDSGRDVKVLGYNEDGIPHRLKLKKNRDGHAVLEGQWGSIMKKKGWSPATRICFWGFPYGRRNSGEPCFVFTDNI